MAEVCSVPNMSAETQITNEICDLLTSNAAQRINFGLGSSRVSGAGFSAVANALREGLKTKEGNWRARIEGLLVGLRIRKSIYFIYSAQAAGVAASYSFSRNTVSAPQGYTLGTWQNRQAILHECVHCLQDMQILSQLFISLPSLPLEVDNEAAAYVAGALYDIYMYNIERKSGIAIFDKASEIAKKIKDTPGAMVGTEDLKELRATILADPVYNKINVQTPSFSDGL